MEKLPFLIPKQLTTVAVVFVSLILFIFLLMLFKYGWLYIQALASGAPISLIQLVGMTLRRVNARVIVESRIMAKKAGLDIDTPLLEAHYLAGGNVSNVVRALIAANKANLDLGFNQACAIDLAGRDVLDAVRTSVTPKIIDCPDPKRGRDTIDGVAKDGIQLKVKARVTVRTNMQRLVGGAREETVIARVGEGIVSSIGAASTHKHVLEHPDLISKQVLQKGLDAGTAFEILSIDIADVDVGDNIGARLQTDQAEAEKRRAMAVAKEQEMRALVEENRAKVVLAEAEVPKAISQAFRDGHLGVMDYYQLRNIQADTEMRKSISKGPGGDVSHT